MLKNIFKYLIIFFAKFIYVFSEIRIPFGLINKNNNDSALFIDKIRQNEIYTNISFGTPPQLIQLNLNTNFELFYLPSNLINTTNSNSMRCANETSINIESEGVTRGYYCSDIIYFNNIEQKVDFILNVEKSNNYGRIGLFIPQQIEPPIYTFLQSLYKSKVVNSYSWTLKYFKNISLMDTINGNESIGEFIFGDEPHRYEKDENQYPYNNYHTVPAIQKTYLMFWELEFNEVYLNLKNGTIISFEGTKQAELDPKVNYLIGPLEYFNALNKTFFKKYFDENICKNENIDNYYGYISCDKEKFSFNDFPKLTMEHKSLENKFNLTGDDLFVLDPKTKKYIFLIFYKSNLSKWKLGSPFLKKHQLVFNEDKKIIGYYVPNIINQEEKEGSSNANYIIIICLLVLIIIGIFIGAALLIKKGIIRLPIKRRANELEEDILYEGKGGSASKNSDGIDTINS